MGSLFFILLHVKRCIHRSLHFAHKSSIDFFSLKTDLIYVQLFKNNPARLMHPTYNVYNVVTCNVHILRIFKTYELVFTF